MSLQLIHKYYQFLVEYKRELDKKNHTAFYQLRKKHRISATTQSILIQHGIIAGKKGNLKWVKGNVSTEMAERLIEELRRKAKLRNEKRKEFAKTDENEIIRSNNEKQIIHSLEKERDELREKLIELKQKLWTKKEPLDISFEINEETVKKHTPKMRKPPKQQTGFTPIKPFKLKDWQEFVLVYIISAFMVYLIFAFIKMDADLTKWNPLDRALIGFFIPVVILISWVRMEIEKLRNKSK